MKKIHVIFVLLASFFFIGSWGNDFLYACDATYMGSADSFLVGCAPSGTSGVSPSQGGGVTSIKDLVINFAEKVIQFGALLAIGAIVFSGVQYTTSYGDDEKVKKAKNTGIFAIIGLLLLLTAFSLVDIVVNFIYSLGG